MLLRTVRMIDCPFRHHRACHILCCLVAPVALNAIVVVIYVVEQFVKANLKINFAKQSIQISELCPRTVSPFRHIASSNDANVLKGKRGRWI